jgi:dynein heavy chain 2
MLGGWGGVAQTHLKKLFAGIHKVVFGEGNKTITEMQSMAGERVPLLKAVPVDENVETWLGLLAGAMVHTLSTMLGQCIALKDYQKYPSQLLSIADMHHFTQKAESAMGQGKLAAFRGELMKQLEEYTSYNAEGHRVMQLKLQSLVLDLIHNIDIVDQLVRAELTEEEFRVSKV